MFGGFFGGGGFGGGVFEAHYRAMPVAFIDKQSAEFGDKVILPPSALDRLASLHIEYPMLFRVESTSTGRATHCGVLEFVAEEGVVYMPHWMMQNMLLQVGDTVKFRNVSLPKGTYVKLQPATSDFLDITNPKAVLERTLRAYTCLTVGDCFVVNYNNRNYEIEVKEAKPGNAISVVETDCQVDFEAPKDYKEPERVVKPPPKAEPAPAAAAGDKAGTSGAAGAAGAAEPEPEQPAFLAFAGTARRLDGKAPSATSQPVPVPAPQKLGALPASITQGAGTSAAAAKTGTTPPAAGGAKAGTFVGNRLLAKLEKEKAGAGSGHAAPAAKPAAAEPEKKDAADEGPKFSAFTGKGYSLKG